MRKIPADHIEIELDRQQRKRERLLDTTGLDETPPARELGECCRAIGVYTILLDESDKLDAIEWFSKAADWLHQAWERTQKAKNEPQRAKHALIAAILPTDEALMTRFAEDIVSQGIKYRSP